MLKHKWKLEAKAPEAAIFHGSGSGRRKHEMNGSESGSSKKILEAEAMKITSLVLGSESGSWKRKRRKRLFSMEAEAEAVNIK